MQPRTLRAPKAAVVTPPRLVERKLRFTRQTIERVEAYRMSRDGKPEADCWRDLVYAGLNALGVGGVGSSSQAPAVAGTIRHTPASVAA